MLCGYRARDNFSKRPQLLIGVNRFHRYKDVKSRCAGSFQKTYDPQFFQLFMERSRNRNNHGEIRSIGRVQIEEKIVRMLEVIEPAGPRIVVDAAESC